MAYLLIFGVGTIAGMMLITAAIAVPVSYSTRFQFLHRHLGTAAGVLSLGFGLFLVYQIGFVDGLCAGGDPVETPGSPTPATTMSRERVRIVVRGAVQGVGFRPFVYRLATELDLNGWVINSAQGVFIEIEGASDRVLPSFTRRLKAEKPARAIIQSCESSHLDPLGYKEFEIRESTDHGGKSALILPDIATCDDCLRETFRSAGSALSLSLHQLHQLRTAFLHHRSAPLRSGQHLNEKVRDVRRLRSRILQPSEPPFPCRADRLPALRSPVDSLEFV